MSDNRKIRFIVALDVEYDNDLINHMDRSMDRIRQVLNNKKFGFLIQTGAEIPNDLFIPINEDIRENKGKKKNS